MHACLLLCIRISTNEGAATVVPRNWDDDTGVVRLNPNTLDTVAQDRPVTMTVRPLVLLSLMSVTEARDFLRDCPENVHFDIPETVVYASPLVPRGHLHIGP